MLGRQRAEPIEVKSFRFNYFPCSFLWHGEERRIEAVEQTWTTRRGNTLDRHYFLVRCADRKYTLYQDLRENVWKIQA